MLHNSQFGDKARLQTTTLSKEAKRIDKRQTRILLIEDDPTQAAIIRAILRKVETENLQVKWAENLSNGLECLSKTSVDIVLLDLLLPDSRGMDTFTSVYRQAPKVPVIILSSLDDEMIAIQAVREGAQDYLVKDQVHGDLLVRAVHYAIERKKAEQSLRAANERLRELDRLKSDFVSTVSHELRTPIAIMREGASLCLDEVAGKITETQRGLLSDVLENADRLNRLVTDLLDISKIESGKVELRKGSIDLCDIAEQVCRAFEKQAEEKGVKLKTYLPDTPPKLCADGDKITQILTNLVSNAIRFTNAGGKVTIRIADKEDAAKCSVSDTGFGIAEKNIPRLFSKFEQIARSDGPGYRGTGLGLAIAKGLVEQHGGKIGVESQPGQGSTFWFTLKKAQLPKILVVDDEISVVRTVKELLGEHNYRFIEARDGDEAMEKAHNEDPSLIILDMNLPRLNGYEVIGQLKQDTRTNDIPVLIISDHSVDERRLRQANVHAVIPVVRKPFEPVELRNSTRELLTE